MVRLLLPNAATVAVLLAITTVSAAETVDFERDIAPIFEERCSYCHGEDEQESGLRLDQRASLLRGGDSGFAAVVPGKPSKSYLLDLVNHAESGMEMPPDDDKLPESEIELLTRWIQQGAVWPGQMQEIAKVTSDHWSFQSVQRPSVPQAGVDFPITDSYGNSLAVPRNEIDAFLLRKLNQKQLSFSKPAEPRDLIRRVSIVLTGLAPTPQQTQTFIDAFAQAPDETYQSLVDRLLQSPHFGERWAQHWLDVIRWAETNGSEANLYRKNAWIYRDYVVRAFNNDMPYDQFVREQIAGDSMGAGEATGFLVAGPHVPAATVGREPTAIRQARADRLDEIMQTVGASMMGITVGCARCHNHKFDPITIKDYYSMTAVFEDIEFGSRFPEFGSDHPRRIRGEALRKQIAEQRQLLRETGGWEEDWGAFRELHFPPVTTRSIRLRFKMTNVGLDELQVFGPDERNVNLAHQQQGTLVSGQPEKGLDGRFPIERLIDGEFGTMTWRAQSAKDSEDRPWVRLDFEQPRQIDRLRLSSNREYFYDTDYLTKKPYLPRYEYDVDVLQSDGSWQPWVGTWSVNKDLNQKHPERRAALAEIQQSIELLAEQGPRPSFVGRLIRPAVTHVLLRGSPESPRDEVMPAGPEILDGDLELSSETPGSQRRAEFAQWISSSENPLTARVMVNRIWHHIFGNGIVTTTSDFGAAGSPPSHPELLDWMAAEFAQPVGADAKPWSIKAMIRKLVLSSAFRQSSHPNPHGLATDAGSTLLWRFPPRRMEAEVIRDNILQASQSLDQSLGGRSFRIHNEKKTYAQWEVVNNHGPDTWRRMLYQERMRRVDDELFTAFDFPDCGQVRAKRPVSTTPLQALNLMNSDFVIEQSQLIADHASQATAGDLPKSIRRCFELLLDRAPDPDELDACLQLANENDLSLVCRALINSNEFAFLP
ncbi:PSD1 and planctomycete cytochrome C domain-containing protein [Stieleria sp. TO1_6]|uniref:PSD1 and planctomycete cytochrome C domain-containing protein n=1 Tax=Stieleria tagensis TaxID=2956795 RepID=UPI00209B2E8B|nr:PSD1 and planctomycete cytochrome C domain-containing protein [Stieleria tagensis]MCO8121608.1 PSD1 and planctomycete cytochrome C domain-containing protein [Stieleria tagensis]